MRPEGRILGWEMMRRVICPMASESSSTIQLRNSKTFTIKKNTKEMQNSQRRCRGRAVGSREGRWSPDTGPPGARNRPTPG